ncbi:hypothetical protein LBWT_A0270 (plasmid) [Leptolyngbya boryana IAM M-101]|nr:hypothetical protein LBWT_A0270 [Leptolyngbya boryana IAM M-101]BAS66205.1 hypothetical protein LBDG_A0270 [Leptolyngbya boryana dg5]
MRVGGVPTLVPIAIAAPPEEMTINPNDQIEKRMVKACDGRKVIGLTYPEGSEPEVEIKFSGAVMELEALMHGKIVAQASGATEVMVFAEFNSADPPGARPSGTIGNSVLAQTEATSKALVTYIDPDTKLAVKVTVKDASDTLVDDECSIGAGMLFTFSPELEAKAVDIQAWVPCSVSNATIVTAEPLGLVSIFAQGVSFDNKARLVSIWSCSRTESAPLADTSERTIKLTILQSPQSASGLGFDIVDTSLLNAC